MSQDKKFCIGGYQFDNYYEYRAAQEDVQKIECINQELDVQNPEVAVRLYNDIRDGIITFNSPIGKQFADHVADIVANKSEVMLDDRAMIREAEGQVKHQKVLGLVLVLLGIIAFGGFVGYEIKEAYETRQLAKLHENLDKKAEEIAKNDTNNADINTREPQDVVPEKHSEENTQGFLTSTWDTSYSEAELDMMPEFADLYAQNSDLVGWLEVVDTDINYPVMQTPNDPEYYLRRDFNKQDDNNGTLFVDYRCDVINPTTNTIIYGHNMRSGKMFGPLKKYLDHDYFEKHKTIVFNTLYFTETYEVVTVGLSKVGYNDDSGYNYYDFIDAVSEEDYQEFLSNIQSLSVFEDPVDIDYNDKLLTLSTCNSYTEDGRLFVVAKRVQ